MSEAMMNTPILDGFEAWVAGRPSAAARRHSYGALLRDGMPTRRQEDWRFTELGPWKESRLCVGDCESSMESGAFAGLDPDAMEVDFVNGRLVAAPEVAGMHIRPWSDEDTAAEDIDLSATSSLERLHRTWCDRGAVIEVDANAHIERPLHLRFWSAAGEGFFPQSRVVVRLGESSRLRLLEHHCSVEGAAFHLHVDAELSAGAYLEHVQLTRVASTAAHATTLRSRAARDASHRHWNLALGGAWVRNELRCRLEAPNAAVELNGLTVADSQQMIDAHTRIEHAADHTRSAEHYRHVLDGEARVVFAGRVHVAKGVHDSDAQQQTATLLLSDDARMNALPQLEIYNDEVKASHGSSMGELDEDALFYLRSRGIPAAAARDLLIWGFANTIVQQLDWPSLSRLVQSEVRSHLSGVALEGEL